MRVYISGPISGTTDFRERFRVAAERLTKLGIDFVNPAELYKAMPGAAHQDYLAVCMRMISTCNAILMLPGFEKSEGCLAEFDLAKKLNMPVWLDLLGTVPQYESV